MIRAEGSHMGNPTNWIVNAFKLFDALIGPRRQPQPDQSAELLTQDPAPEASADSRPDPILHIDLPVEADASLEPPPAQEDETVSVQQDDESRRKLVRQLFNEYWTGIDDKPPTFAERLEVAAGYINERLADRAVGWRLDGVTRKQLGLPASPMHR
jgi:hypothetical protein